MNKNKKSSSSESKRSRIHRHVRLDVLFGSDGGVTIRDILNDPKIDVVSKRTIQNDISEFQKEFNATFRTDLFRGKEKIWKYNDPNFSVFPKTNDMDIIRVAIERLNAYKPDPRYDWLKSYLQEIQKGFSDTSINALSFDFNDDYEGLEHIKKLLEAIINRYPLKMRYKPFGKPEFETNIHPYHLRQYNKRWFLFGYVEEKDSVLNYALDRIVEVNHLQKEYRDGNINFDVYFDEIVGVSNDVNKQVEKVKLKINKKSYDYIRSKPIHNTQKVLNKESTDEYIIVSLTLKINMELKMLIFSYADAIEVLEPAWLRDEFAVAVKKLSSKYKV